MVELKLSEDIKTLNEKIKKLDNTKNWYKTELKNNYTMLKYSKTVEKILNDNGVNIKKNYLNSKTEKPVFNAIYNILKTNSNIFTDITE